MRHNIFGLAVIAIGMVGGFVMHCGSSFREPIVDRRYHDNGRLSIEQQLDDSGRIHGYQKCWDSSGTLIEEYQFDHGQVVVARAYNPDGTVKSERREGAKYQMTSPQAPQATR